MNKERMRLALQVIAGMQPNIEEVRIIDPGAPWRYVPYPAILRDIAIEAIIEEIQRDGGTDK